MVDILHRIGITASLEDVADALTTLRGLAGWWTKDVQGGTGVGDVIQFRFPQVPGGGGCDAKVVDSEPGKLVRWEIVAGPDEWIGTHVRFELSQDDEYTIILFKHEGWKEPGEFMHHCSTKWAGFLMSLKKYAETGTGNPHPDDVQISNWR
jgi:hypothetical protein